jgi:hypothetical protein
VHKLIAMGMGARLNISIGIFQTLENTWAWEETVRFSSNSPAFSLVQKAPVLIFERFFI